MACGSSAKHEGAFTALLVVAIGFIALLFLGTALVRVCPLYTVLRVTTNAREARPR